MSATEIVNIWNGKRVELQNNINTTFGSDKKTCALRLCYTKYVSELVLDAILDVVGILNRFGRLGLHHLNRNQRGVNWKRFLLEFYAH